ncbi:MAG: type II secretion system F family protein, partial [Pirellulaceae bacterium]|nr:type II secretion system F family protein [Pirellulaceae bacterium]
LSLKLEQQLVDCIDLLVGSIKTGSSLQVSWDSMTTQIKKPLKPILTDLANRVRLGDSPQAEMERLAVQVPIETFILFATTLKVHWNMGGGLATALAGIARTVRDRIEISRKLHANTVQAQFSVFIVLIVTYLIAGTVWVMNGEHLREFLESTVAAYLVSGSIILQAIGILWMRKLSQMRF